MSTDAGIWGWTGDIGQLGFTVTFSLGRTPDDVLIRYGADPRRAEQLTRKEAWARYPPNYNGTQLRAGLLGRWGFCFEEAGFAGTRTSTLGRLSVDTETISFCSAAGTNSFIHLKDGHAVELFEPGLPETVRGEEPCKFWADTQKIMNRVNHLDRANQTTPMTPAHAVLQAITKHIRGPLDRTTLEGPLLTIFLSDVRHIPMSAESDGDPTRPQTAIGGM